MSLWPFENCFDNNVTIHQLFSSRIKWNSHGKKQTICLHLHCCWIFIIFINCCLIIPIWFLLRIFSTLNSQIWYGLGYDFVLMTSFVIGLNSYLHSILDWLLTGERSLLKCLSPPFSIQLWKNLHMYFVHHNIPPDVNLS